MSGICSLTIWLCRPETPKAPHTPAGRKSMGSALLQPSSSSKDKKRKNKLNIR